MFDPTDFLKIANRYHASPLESERRTAIGRSYYAVYNLLIGKLSKEGVLFKENATDHGTLVYYLVNSKVLEAQKAGGALKDLRNDRNDADYRMEKDINVQQSTFTFQKAQRTITQFKVLSSTKFKQLAAAIHRLPPPSWMNK